MKISYQNQIIELLKRTIPKLSTQHKVEFKNIFGATGGYISGKIFISSGKFGVALKLPKKVLDNLFEEKDVNPLKYFPKGHIKKDYAILPKRILNNKSKCRKLLKHSIQFVKK